MEYLNRFLVPIIAILFVMACDKNGSDIDIDLSTGLSVDASQGQVVDTSQAVIADTHYFVGTDGMHGLELWKTDGTYSGTVMVKDILPGSGWSADHITLMHGEVYFTVNPGYKGAELWRSDGTEEGTVRVEMYGPKVHDIGYLNVVNGELYFIKTVWTKGDDLEDKLERELWKTDGTRKGTVKVKSFKTRYLPRVTALAADSDELYLFLEGYGDTYTGSTLWRTDGTEEGTYVLASVDLKARTSIFDMVAVNDGVYFLLDTESGSEVWKSDGTETGTVMVKDMTRADCSGPDVSDLINVNNTLFFNAEYSCGGDYTHELWKIDGSNGNVEMVKEHTGLFMEDQTNVNGVLYFTLYYDDDNGALWRSDGTTVGTVIIKSFKYTCDIYVRELANVMGTLYFTSSDCAGGNELWRTDGTEHGTYLVKKWKTDPMEESHLPMMRLDYYSNSEMPFGKYKGPLVFPDGRFLLFADDGIFGYEPHISDGTSAGTYMINDINPGHANGVVAY